MKKHYLILSIALLFSCVMGHSQDLIRDAQAGLKPSSADPPLALTQAPKTFRIPAEVQRPFEFLEKSANEERSLLLNLNTGVLQEILAARGEYVELAIIYF